MKTNAISSHVYSNIRECLLTAMQDVIEKEKNWRHFFCWEIKTIRNMFTILQNDCGSHAKYSNFELNFIDISYRKQKSAI